MIVIFSDTDDVHADAVESCARLRGSEVARINGDEVHRWSLEFLSGEPLLSLDGRTFAFDKIRSIFIRRLPNQKSFKRHPTSAPAQAQDYIAKQRFIQTSDCIALLSECTKTINTITSAQRAQSKASQLFIASKLGFRIPKTYSGDNPQHARQHISEITQSGGRACTKPIMNSFLMIENQTRTRFTELLDENDIAGLDSLRGCPLTFQDYIEKSYELRVTVVGDRVFACKIDSQQAGGVTAVDWRRYNIPKTPHSRYDLPASLREKLLSFHSYFGLTASSFDIVRSREGEFVFLETNPYGQWLWIEDLTGLPITEAITDILLQ